MKTPESYTKDKIRNWLREQGAYVFSPTQMGYGQQTVDLLVCWQGQFIALEVKQKGKKPTTRQWLTIEEVRNAGGKAAIVSSLEDVQVIFTGDIVFAFS